MREAVKDAIIGLQASSDEKNTRLPEAQGKRGLWPGHPNPGSFVKGADPRRGDGSIAKAKKMSIEALAGEHAELAVGALVDVLSDASQPALARVTAAEKLLDRGFGRSVDRTVAISLNDQGNKPTKQLTRDEILAKLSQRFTEVSHDTDQPGGVTYESGS